MGGWVNPSHVQESRIQVDTEDFKRKGVDLPGGPVIKKLSMRGYRFDPWSWKIPQAAG